jgi:hypothetical protein
MQGYGLARPMPAEAIGPWLARYTPDPLWQLASTPRPSRTDFQLLLAEAGHRFWVDRVLAQARGLGGLETPTGDYRTCQFGRWYYGQGMRLYGRSKDFSQLEQLHRRAHDLGERLLASDIDRDAAGFLDLESRLLETRNKLMDCLRGMRHGADEIAIRDVRRTPPRYRRKP